MSDIPKVGQGSPARGTDAHTEKGVEKKEGDSAFDRVLGKKEGKDRKPGVHSKKGPGEKDSDPKGKRDTDEGKHPVIPGSVMVHPSTAGSIGLHKTEGSAPVLPSRMIEQIAQKIVTALQVKTRADVTEMQLSIDMGRLGQLQVNLIRSADGKLNIALQTEHIQAREALAGQADGLLQRLEARGLEVQNLRIQTMDGQGIDLKPGQDVPMPVQPGGEANEARQRQPGDEQQRERKPHHEETDEDNE